MPDRDVQTRNTTDGRLVSRRRSVGPVAGKRSFRVLRNEQVSVVARVDETDLRPGNQVKAGLDD